MSDYTLEYELSNGSQKSITFDTSCPYWTKEIFEPYLKTVAGYVFQLLEVPYFDFVDKERFLQNSMTNLVTQLNQEVIEQLLEKNDRKGKVKMGRLQKVVPKFLSHSSKNNAVENFERKPHLKNILDTSGSNFIRNLEGALFRTRDRLDDISREMFQCSKEIIRLVNVKSTNADVHKGGHRTSILEFVRKSEQQDLSENQEVLKVIYKPSNLEADTLLIGQKRDGEEGDANKDEELPEEVGQTERTTRASLVEFLNSFEPAKEKRLPTYRILSYEDPENHPELSYGFIQYLPHEEEIDYQSELNILMEKIYKHGWSNSYQRVMIQMLKEKQRELKRCFPNSAAFLEQGDEIEAFNQELNTDILHKVKAYLGILESFNRKKQYLEKGKSGQTQDYIFTSKEELERYFYLCGKWIAFAVIFGISDLHRENMIVSGLLPFLIDLENSFQPFVYSSEGTGMTESQHGALIFSKFKFSKVKGLFCRDNSGAFIEIPGVLKYEKNGSFEI